MPVPFPRGRQGSYGRYSRIRTIPSGDIIFVPSVGTILAGSFFGAVAATFGFLGVIWLLKSDWWGVVIAGALGLGLGIAARGTFARGRGLRTCRDEGIITVAARVEETPEVSSPESIRFSFVVGLTCRPTPRINLRQLQDIVVKLADGRSLIIDRSWPLDEAEELVKDLKRIVGDGANSRTILEGSSQGNSSGAWECSVDPPSSPNRNDIQAPKV